MSRATFWDMSQMTGMVEILSKQAVSKNASNVVMRDLDDDHPLRKRLMRR